MASVEEPPYLTVGTDVSAKYKGAFCEAKITDVNKHVKLRVSFDGSSGSYLIEDSDLKAGTALETGSKIEARHPEKKQNAYVQATITKILDHSRYTVVFDDGDQCVLRRNSLCLKSGKHFAESETLDRLPLTNPEHFGNPVKVGAIEQQNQVNYKPNNHHNNNQQNNNHITNNNKTNNVQEKSKAKSTPATVANSTTKEAPTSTTTPATTGPGRGRGSSGKGRKRRESINNGSKHANELDSSSVDSAADSNEADGSESIVKFDLIDIGVKLMVQYGKGRVQNVYEAKVNKIEMNSFGKMKYFVHYTGWNNRYDEWITRSRIVKIVSDKENGPKDNRSRNTEPTISVAASAVASTPNSISQSTNNATRGAPASANHSNTTTNAPPRSDPIASRDRDKDKDDDNHPVKVREKLKRKEAKCDEKEKTPSKTRGRARSSTIDANYTASPSAAKQNTSSANPSSPPACPVPVAGVKQESEPQETPAKTRRARQTDSGNKPSSTNSKNDLNSSTTATTNSGSSSNVSQEGEPRVLAGPPSCASSKEDQPPSVTNSGPSKKENGFSSGSSSCAPSETDASTRVTTTSSSSSVSITSSISASTTSLSSSNCSTTTTKAQKEKERIKDREREREPPMKKRRSRQTESIAVAATSATTPISNTPSLAKDSSVGSKANPSDKKDESSRESPAKTRRARHIAETTSSDCININFVCSNPNQPASTGTTSVTSQIEDTRQIEVEKDPSPKTTSVTHPTPSNVTTVSPLRETKEESHQHQNQQDQAANAAASTLSTISAQTVKNYSITTTTTSTNPPITTASSSSSSSASSTYSLSSASANPSASSSGKDSRYNHEHSNGPGTCIKSEENSTFDDRTCLNVSLVDRSAACTSNNSKPVYRFCEDIDESDCDRKISILQDRIMALRQTYQSLKTELADLDRRRKRPRTERPNNEHINCSLMCRN